MLRGEVTEFSNAALSLLPYPLRIAQGGALERNRSQEHWNGERSDG
jgi:hypothetical protein